MRLALRSDFGPSRVAEDGRRLVCEKVGMYFGPGECEGGTKCNRPVLVAR